MERETKKITIADHEVEIYTYITAGEARQIEAVYLEGMEVSVDEEGKTVMPSVNANLASIATDKTIELMVVSVDGDKEGCLKKLLALPRIVMDTVMETLNEVTRGLNADKKKEKKLSSR